MTDTDRAPMVAPEGDIDTSGHLATALFVMVVGVLLALIMFIALAS